MNNVFGRIVDDQLSAAPLRSQLGLDASGAVVTFEGVSRSPSNGKELVSLYYEAYRPVADQQIHALAVEAAEKWNLPSVVALHRTGLVPTGECGIVVLVAAPHRSEAFAATEWLVTAIKSNVAIWKQERYDDGTTQWIGSPVS